MAVRIRFRTINKYQGLVIFYIFFAVWCVLARDYTTRIEYTPAKPHIDEEIQLDIYVLGEYFPDLKVTEPVQTSGLHFAEGPFVRPVVSENGLVISYIMQAERIGSKILGNFIIKIGSALITTEPITIDIFSQAEIRIKDKPKGEWVLTKDQVYERETVSVTLELTIWDRLAMPEQIVVNPPKNAWLEEFVGTGEVRNETFNDRLFYVFPVKSFLLTTTKEGYITIPSAKIVFRDGEVLFSESRRVQLLPLDDAIERYGAIGIYQLSSWVENQAVQENEDVVVHVKLSGKGNLKFANLPVPESSELHLLGETVIEEINATLNGYNGCKEQIWRYQTRSTGEDESIVCVVPNFTYLNVEQNEIMNIPAQRYEITIEAQGTDWDKPTIESEFPLRDRDTILLSVPRLTYSNWVTYLFFLPGPAICILFMKTRKKWKAVFFGLLIFSLSGNTLYEIDQSIDVGIAEYYRGNYTSSLSHFLAAASHVDSNAALQFNLALCYVQLRDHVHSIYYLRNILKTHPLDDQVQTLLQRIETDLELSNQISPGTKISPQFTYIVLIVLINGFFILLVLAMRKRQVWILVPIVLISLCIIVDAVLFATALVQLHQITGIIMVENTPVKRIPEELSRDWLFLKEGTALRILTGAHGFLYVRTGSGVEGWVMENAVLYES